MVGGLTIGVAGKLPAKRARPRPGLTITSWWLSILCSTGIATVFRSGASVRRNPSAVTEEPDESD
jgi:hypothetical protein